jgi:outer membrane protein assembly factor BamB
MHDAGTVTRNGSGVITSAALTHEDGSALALTGTYNVSPTGTFTCTFVDGATTIYDATGAVKWSHGPGFFGTLMAADGKLLVHIDDMLYALSIETGEPLWTFKGGSSHGTSAIVKVGEPIYIHTTGGDLVRVSDGVCAATKVGGTGFNAAIVDGERLGPMAHRE